MTSNPLLHQCSPEAYIEQVERELAQTLATRVAVLVEPRRVTPTARKEMAKIVEVVVGFAFGTVVGGVLDGVRRWYGAEVSAALMARMPRGAAEARSRIDVAYLVDRERRPMVDLFAGTLHVRFARMGRDVERMLGELACIIEERRLRDVTPVVLHLLAKEDDVVVRVGAEIELAWAMFVAAMGNGPRPSLEGRTARSEGLWRAWLGTQPGGAPGERGGRDAHQRDGYILRVN